MENPPKGVSEAERWSRRKFIRDFLGPLALLTFLGPPPPTAETTAETLPPSEIIDGIETFGHLSPLTQEETDTLITNFNEKFDLGQTLKGPNTFYATEGIQHDEYNNIPPLTGDATYQQFLARHDQWLDGIIKATNNPFLAGLAWDERRLMRVAQGVSLPGSWHLGWLTEGIKDSNGIEGLWFILPYDPTESYWWDEVNKIDKGRGHEKGHKVLHLPDIYELNGYFGAASWGLLSHPLFIRERASLERRIPQLREDIKKAERDRERPGLTAVPPPLEDIPEAWHTYIVSDRNDDRGGGLMTLCGAKLCSYETWMLARRAANGWLHNAERTIPEQGGDFSNEVAAINTLVLGQEFNGAQVQLWQSGGDYVQKTLEDLTFEGVVEDGEVSIDNLLQGVDLTPDGLVPGFNGLFFLKVIKDGQTYWRYLDIGDFSVGLGERYYPFELKMSFALASGEMTPEELDWAIAYEKLNAPHQNYLPYCS